MRIRASIPGYQEIELNLTPSHKVSDLKRAVSRRLGIEPELTTLLLNGKRLAETTPLSKIKSEGNLIIIDYLWARQLLIWGASGQDKLRKATVLLAGAGAIGNEAAKNLAMLGVGRIQIVDRDTVEMSNISRMMFFHQKDLGKNKAEVLAENLHTKYPHVETTAYRGNLESMPLKLYLDSQVVLCGLDNVVSRIFLTQICRKYSIPLVDAGIIGVTGRIQSYIPPNDTCPICLFPHNQYSNIVGLRNPCEAPLGQEAVPSFATSISLVSSILAQEAIKVILGLADYMATRKWPEMTGQPLRSALFLDLKNNRYTPMAIERNPRCIVCGKDGTARESTRIGTLPIETLRGRPLEASIRKAANIQDGKLTPYLENSHGTKRIDSYSSNEKLVRRGDYLRILVETENGELHESILRLR